MSPDVEWLIEDEVNQRTIVKTEPPRSPRWRVIVVAFIITVGLSIIYGSNPHSPAQQSPIRVEWPMSAPVVTSPPTLPPVRLTVMRESEALAMGDLAAFMAVQDSEDFEWRQHQRIAFEKWGTPSPDTELYNIIGSATYAEWAWADVSQFRQGYFFRETRFYRLQGNQWRRTRPVIAFWGEERTANTASCFTVQFHEQDSALVILVADQIEQTIEQLCQQIECWRHNTLDHPLKIALSFQPELDHDMTDREESDLSASPAVRRITITLPSPRIMGIYYQDLSANSPQRDERLEQIAYTYLALPIAQLASGDFHRWSNVLNQGGIAFLQAIVHWELQQMGVEFDRCDRFHPDLLADRELPVLSSIWNWSVAPAQLICGTANDSQWLEANALIAFIDQTFGAHSVIKFLHAIGPAQSLSDAIEAGLGIKYVEFQQQWRLWLHQYKATERVAAATGQ